MERPPSGGFAFVQEPVWRLNSGAGQIEGQDSVPDRLAPALRVPSEILNFSLICPENTMVLPLSKRHRQRVVLASFV